MPLGICDQCGHVQIARLPQAREVAVLNKQLFDNTFDPTTADTRSSEHDSKGETIVNRLAAVVGDKGGGLLLDVGAGEGWSQSVAQHFGFDYHVVEPDPDLAARLKARGATIASGGIEDLVPEGWSQQFKVIILRHALEHLLDPIGDLATLAQCLAPDGILYVALPNFTKARPKAGFRTDYLRPVHISYFTPNKLDWCLHSAGLKAHSIKDEYELWAIADQGLTPVKLLDERDDNQGRLSSLIHANRSRDARNIRRILIYRLFVRLPSIVQRMVRWGRGLLSDSRHH
jgi:SAM-dependent methyltransferase